MDVARLLFGFQGRLNRRQFWIAACTVNPAIGLLLLSLGIVRSDVPARSLVLIVAGALIAIQLWINLAVIAKRLHDRGRSGWLLLVFAVPVIGGFWLAVELYFLNGTSGPNQFGPPPGDAQGAVSREPMHPLRYAGPKGDLSANGAVMVEDRGVVETRHVRLESRVFRRLSGWDAVSLDLRRGETVIKEGPANLKRGLEAVGGKLWLTDQRLAFRAHGFNIQTGATDVERGDWTATRKLWTAMLGIPVAPNSFALRTCHGVEYRFVVNGREDWVSRIEATRTFA